MGHKKTHTQKKKNMGHILWHLYALQFHENGIWNKCNPKFDSLYKTNNLVKPSEHNLPINDAVTKMFRKKNKYIRDSCMCKTFKNQSEINYNMIDIYLDLVYTGTLFIFIL